jgi:hypothetical protein
MSRAHPPPLVEGVDYYMEGTKLVFTAAYHRKRGYCCNSKCRHCPYGADHTGPTVDFVRMGSYSLPGMRRSGR